METQIFAAFKSDGTLDPETIENAAAILKAGDLVAFPTETVYGLGANALDPAAVAQIFEAKGRPSHNPLIVHVANVEQAQLLVSEWPPEAELLAEAFWPGPLTLVLKKSSIIPDIVTAGGETVALRLPAHPVARALINACGFPLAAPSANRSNQVSPTTAEHVMWGMTGKIPMILDGGPCEAGIESTVLNMSSPSPAILRPGVLSANFLSQVLGANVLQASKPTSTAGEPRLSPGQLNTHYAPRTKLFLVESATLAEAVSHLAGSGKRIGLMAISDPTYQVPASRLHMVAMSSNPENYARQLYATLHNLDAEILDSILCEIPPDTPEWAGIHDRLSRAGRPFQIT